MSMVLSCSYFCSADWRRHKGEKLVEEYCAHKRQSCSKSIIVSHVDLIVLTIDVAKVQLSGELDDISFEPLLPSIYYIPEVMCRI
jgi:hypothetical protein